MGVLRYPKVAVVGELGFDIAKSNWFLLLCSCACLSLSAYLWCYLGSLALIKTCPSCELVSLWAWDPVIPWSWMCQNTLGVDLQLGYWLCGFRSSAMALVLVQAGSWRSMGFWLGRESASPGYRGPSTPCCGVGFRLLPVKLYVSENLKNWAVTGVWAVWYQVQH